MEQLFAPYQGQQVQPVPPGFLEAFNQVGRNYAEGMSNLGSGLARGRADWKQKQLLAKSADFMVKSYDTKGEDGQVKNIVLEQMGIHPDQWNTLGADDKTAAVMGVMKGMAAKQQQQEMEARMQEQQARKTMLDNQTAESDAMSTIAPLAQQWAAANPGKQPAPADILSWMSNAKLNPRAQASVLGKLIPSMMNGEGATPMPVNWTDAQGNSWVVQGHNLQRSQPAFDPAQFMGADGTTTATGDYTPMPDGKGGVRYLKNAAKKQIPPTMQSLLMKHLDDFNDATTRLETPDADLTAAGLNPKTVRTSLSNRQKTALKNGQTLIDTQHKLGNLSDDERDSFYQSFGISPQNGSAPSERITVYKDGKQFTVPANQKDEAVKAGYSLTK